MERYIEGYYCRDERDLRIVDKESNRAILQALRNAYPLALDAYELSSKTGLPIKTVYSQLAELYREYFTAVVGNKVQPPPRGRPALKDNSSGRNRSRVIIEEVSEMFDPYDGRESGETPLPPGKVQFSGQFIHIWNLIKVKEDVEEVTLPLLRSIKKFVRASIESQDFTVASVAPMTGTKCCSQCGVNHEVRDFIRALSLRLIDEMEESKEFLEFFKENNIITDETFSHALAKLPDSPKASKESFRREDHLNVITPVKLQIEDVVGVKPSEVNRLHKAGIFSAKDLANASVKDLAVDINCTKDNAKSLILAAQELLRHSNPSGQPLEFQKSVSDSPKIEDIQGIGPTTVKKLREAGYSSVKDLAVSNVEDLAEEINCTKDTAAEFIIAAQELSREPNILEKDFVSCRECGKNFETVLQLSRHMIIKHKTTHY